MKSSLTLQSSLSIINCPGIVKVNNNELKEYIKEEERSFEMNIHHNSRSANSLSDNY